MQRGSSPPNVFSFSRTGLTSDVGSYSLIQRASIYLEQEDDSKLSITPELQVISALFTESQLISPGAKQISPNFKQASLSSGETDRDLTPKKDTQIPSRIFPTSKTGVLFDERLLAHENYFSEHPECPSRILVIQKALKEQGILDRVFQVSTRPATDEEIMLAHETDYISWLASTAGNDFQESSNRKGCNGI